MKLTKSKQALADAIHASGKGWLYGANWAAQDKYGSSYKHMVWFYSGKEKPYTGKGCSSWQTDYTVYDSDGIQLDKLLPNWHQTVLSREEYFCAYPETVELVADVGGWIEWSGGECLVDGDVDVDTKHRAGRADICRKASSAWWNHRGKGGDIIAYRLHKPESNPDFCESVTRSIPEPEAKPSIEQLAADCRNKLDYAERLQKEADAAKADADIKLAELVEVGKANGLVIGIADRNPELVIDE